MSSAAAALLSLSVSGSLLALLLFAGKPFLKRSLPKAFGYYVWLLVLLRLLVPVAAPVNAMGALFGAVRPRAAQAAGSAAPGRAPVSSADAAERAESASSSSPPPSPLPPGARGASAWKTASGLLPWLWLAGCCASLAWFFAAYLSFARRIRRSCAEPDAGDAAVFRRMCGSGRVRLVCCGCVSTPMLLGVLRPTVVLPRSSYVRGGMERELELILLHELTHYRRGDVLFKWLAALASAVHWFNPLLPLIRREIARACELSCDEAVIGGLPPAGRRAYGNMLIACSAGGKRPAGTLATTLCEEKSALKERLVNIMRYRKKPVWAAAPALALALTLTGCAAALGVSNGAGAASFGGASSSAASGAAASSAPFSRVDTRWQAMWKDIRFTNEWAAEYGRVVLFGSLKSTPEQGVAVVVDPGAKTFARYLTPEKAGAVTAQKPAGSSSAVQVGAQNGRILIFNLYDGFYEKPSGGPYAGAWVQIDHALQYVEGTVSALRGNADGTAVLDLENAVYDNGGGDAVSHSGAVGKMEFVLQKLPAFSVSAGEDVVVYQTGVYPLSGSMDRFLGAAVLYYKQGGRYYGADGKTAAMPPKSYPSFGQVFSTQTEPLVNFQPLP